MIPAEAPDVGEASGLGGARRRLVSLAAVLLGFAACQDEVDVGAFYDSSVSVPAQGSVTLPISYDGRPVATVSVAPNTLPAGTTLAARVRLESGFTRYPPKSPLFSVAPRRALATPASVSVVIADPAAAFALVLMRAGELARFWEKPTAIGGDRATFDVDELGDFVLVELRP